MTNEITVEEAVKQIKENCYFASISEKTKQALEIAIKALEQQPCDDVLDNIKAEIIDKYGNCHICEWFEDYDYDENDISEYMSVGHISDIIDIIDKYRK